MLATWHEGDGSLVLRPHVPTHRSEEKQEMEIGGKRSVYVFTISVLKRDPSLGGV